MAKKRVPGPNIPVPGHDELRPNDRDASVERGYLAHARPVQFVQDFGAPRDALTDWRGVPSPASPTFKAGVPKGVNPGVKPEPKSMPIQAGRTWPNRDSKERTEP